MISSLARGLERTVSAIFRTNAVSDMPATGHGLDEHKLEDALRRTRYYGISNVLRMLMFVPLVWGLWNGPRWALYPTCTFLLLHALVALSEAVRANGLRRLTPDPVAIAGTAEAKPAPITGWFRLRSWETERFYRLIGVETFRKLVVRYERLTFGGSVQGVTRASMRRFASQTCQAEISHLLALIMDLVPLIGLSVIKSRLTAVAALMVFLDFVLVLLQRAHRARVRRILT